MFVDYVIVCVAGELHQVAVVGRHAFLLQEIP